MLRIMQRLFINLQNSTWTLIKKSLLCHLQHKPNRMKDAQPLVSIILPNYNHERYLKARVESLLAQTFDDYELIFLDDASTDRSVEYLAEMAQRLPQATLHVNSHNSGSPFSQWYKGLKMARGKWVWIAESDDIASPFFLDHCLSAVQGTSAVACFAASNGIDGEGCRLSSDINYWCKYRDYAQTTPRFFNGMEYAEHKLFWHCTIMNASAVIFSREAAMRCDWQSITGMRYAGDWLFWSQMCKQGDIVELYEYLNFFRLHMGSVTQKGKADKRALFEDIDVVKYIMDSVLHMSSYKIGLRRGLLWRKIKNSHLPEPAMRQCRERLSVELHGSKRDYWRLSLNRYLRYVCPWLCTLERDRAYRGV